MAVKTAQDFGFKVEGDINHFTSEPVTQAEPVEFLKALDTLLSMEGVEVVQWEQYTPYFNDGDACEFRIYGSYLKLEGINEGGDYDNGFLDEYSWNYDWDTSTKPYSKIYKETHGMSVETVEKYANAQQTFEKVLENGAHFLFLKASFGDPAKVTATKDGFKVEYYAHD